MPLEGLLKSRLLALPQTFWFRRSRWGLRLWISSKFLMRPQMQLWLWGPCFGAYPSVACASDLQLQVKRRFGLRRSQPSFQQALSDTDAANLRTTVRNRAPAWHPSKGCATTPSHLRALLWQKGEVRTSGPTFWDEWTHVPADSLTIKDKVCVASYYVSPQLCPPSRAISGHWTLLWLS